MFKRYQHIEKYNTEAGEGIELGKVYVFPKLDGSNASVWLAEDQIEIKAGSRNRELSLHNDNQGFYKYILEDCDNVHHYLYKYPTHRLFGEWLIPHSLKTYAEKTWRKFYIFDVMVNDQYLNYDLYKEQLDEFSLDYIPAICSLENGSSEQFYHQLTNSTFLIEDGNGIGEGIVLKNYDFINKFGHTIWAKIVRAEFKALHAKTMGHPEMKGSTTVELKIAEKYITKHFVEKEYAKIVNELNGWQSKDIPRLFNTIFYELVNEDLWDILKTFKDPVINFRSLRNFIIHQIKYHKPDLFY